MKKILFLLLGLLSLHSFASVNFGYSRGSHMALGEGVNVNFPTLKYQRCLDFTKQDFDSGARETIMQSKLVSNDKEMEEVMKVDSLLKSNFRYGVGSGNASFKHHSKSNFKETEKTLILMLKMSSDFGRVGMGQFSLKPKFKALLEEKNHEEFIKKCGTHFVDIENHEASAYLLVKITNLTKNTKKKIVNTFKSHFKYGASLFSGGGDFNYTFDKLLKTVNKHSSLAIEIDSPNGGEGLSSLKKLVKQMATSDIKSIMAGMAEYVGQMSEDKTPATSFQVRSFQIFGLEAPMFDKKRAKFLEKLYYTGLEVEEYISRIEKIKKNNDGMFKTHYDSKLAKLRAKMSIIENIGMRCTDPQAKVCEGKIPKLDDMTWPSELVSYPSLKVTCGYKDNAEYGRLLNSINIEVEGQFTFPEFTNKESLKVFYEDSEGNFKQTRDEFYFSFSKRSEEKRKKKMVIRNGKIEYSEKKETQKFFGPVDQLNLNLAGNYYENRNEVNRKLKEMKQRQYYIQVKNREGIAMTDLLPIPEFKNCSLTKRERLIQF